MCERHLNATVGCKFPIVYNSVLRTTQGKTNLFKPTQRKAM